MAEFTENRDFRSVTLVDRTGRGGAELIFDGVRITLAKGKAEFHVPRFVALWLFRTQKEFVWTSEGQFVNRFAVRDADPEFLAEVGPEAGDTSPIDLDTTRAEGWDTTGVERTNTRTVAVNLPLNLLRERQGTNSESGVFAERKG